jgi:Tfp pilus assembly protein FimT
MKKMEYTNKKRGISIIELIATVAVVGIIAGLTVPNFSQIFGKNKFQEETQALFDLISDARVNAIAEKKCHDEESLISWGITIDQSTRSGKLICHSQSSEERQVEEISFSPRTNISLIEFGDGSTAGSITISFAAETTQTKITTPVTPPTDPPTEEQKKSVGIVIEHLSGDEVRTICIQSVAGFGTLRDDNSCP